MLHSGCNWTCKCAFQRIAKEDYDSCLASLPIPIWQVKLKPSGGHASVFGELGLDAKRQRVIFDQNCLSHFKSSCFCKGWQAQSLWEVFPLPTPSTQASLAIFANPLPRGGNSTHLQGRKTIYRLPSFMRLRQVGSQEGKGRMIVRKELLQRGELYSRLMHWSESHWWLCVCVYVACILTRVSRSGLDYCSQCVVHRFPRGPQDSVCKIIIIS